MVSFACQLLQLKRTEGWRSGSSYWGVPGVRCQVSLAPARMNETGDNDECPDAVFLFVLDVMHSDQRHVLDWFRQWGYVHRIKNVHRGSSYYAQKIAALLEIREPEHA